MIIGRTEPSLWWTDRDGQSIERCSLEEQSRLAGGLTENDGQSIERCSLEEQSRLAGGLTENDGQSIERCH